MLPATRSFRRAAALRGFLPVLLLVAGAAMRLIWTIATLAGSRAEGEIANVAIAYSKTGVLADAFQTGQGPTAHVLPLPPVYAGLIYRTFGIQSPTSEIILAITAIALVTASFGLLYYCFGLIGLRRRWRLAGLAFLCFVPINIHLEIEAFRIWEGAIGAALSALYLLLLLRTDANGAIGWWRLSGMCLLAAFLFWVSPPLGLSAYLCSLLLLIDKLPLRRWPAAFALAAAALALFVVPWAMRNVEVLDAPILLRSNFGLELALANHPAAASDRDAREVFRERLAEIHPFQSKAAFAAMQSAGGEVAYARMLGDEARGWIAKNPLKFARLCGQHLRDFIMPPPWLWNVYSNAGGAAQIKALVHSAVTLIGITGALVSGWVAWRRHRFAVMMLLVPILPYVVTQPVLRYRYIIYGLSVFFAADLLARIADKLGWVQTNETVPDAVDKSVA